MGIIDPQIPVSGQPNSSEDLKIISGMGTIRDEINGELDNDNIKSGANINGNKLLAGSVDTTQLADDAVTNAKVGVGAIDTTELAALAATAGKVDLYLDVVTATVNPGAGTHTLTSISSVPAGTYIAVASINPGALVWSDHDIDSSGGSTSIEGVNDAETVFATVVVTSATQIRQRIILAGAGNITGNLLLFGIKA